MRVFTIYSRGVRGNGMSSREVPHILVGGANGQLKGGRHLAFPTKAVPHSNLLLSILDMYGIHQDNIGDSTGRLAGLV